LKILIFGRGVIGTLYGWALEKAGHSVEFYVRPGRAVEYGSVLPLKFYDARTKLKGELVEENWAIRMREDLPADHDYQLILVSVQHYRFDEAAAYLRPRAGKATLLIFNSFWKDPQASASSLPLDQIAWGFPVAGGGFSKDGVLSGALFHRVEFGTFGADPTKRELAVYDLFRKSGFKIQQHRDFRGWLWGHFVLDAGLLSQALQAGGSMKVVMASTSHGRNAILNIRELLPVLQARGVDLNAHALDLAVARLPLWLSSLGLKLIVTFNAPTKAIVESHANPEELRRVCRDVLDEARKLGISVPRLEAAAPLFPS
jgi:2-dehydropantoate 2-reductase